MDMTVIAVVAALASALTLYSGFGLGTILLPAFALFFPVPVAVAATGVVHLLNNVFKAGLLWRQADWRVVLRFGLTAVPAAMLGAWLLARLGDTPRLFEWSALGRTFGPTGASLAVGLLLQIFTANLFGPIFFEIIQRKGNEAFGEGNFQALFDSIELDQIRRGVIKVDA